MKKIGLVCTTLLVGLSLAGCNNLASQQSHKSSSSSSSTKVVKVKHHKTHKKQAKKQSKKSSSSTHSAATSSAQNNKNSEQSVSYYKERVPAQKNQTQTSNVNQQAQSSSDDDEVDNLTIKFGDNGNTNYEFHTHGAPTQADKDSAMQAATSLNNAGVYGDVNN